MAIVSSGKISFTDIQNEFGGSNPISLNEYYRGGAYTTINNTNVPVNGDLRMSNFYGTRKHFVFNAVISSDIFNYNLKSAAIAAGWDQVLPLSATVTINSGVYVGSTSTGSHAFDTGSNFTADSSLVLINNGFIVGRGGNGGQGGYQGKGTSRDWGYPGGAGGPALIANASITIVNNGTIGGGGGGGGGGPATVYAAISGPGGGGGRGSYGGSGGPHGAHTYGGAIAGNDGGAGTKLAAGAGGARACSGSNCNGAAGNGGDLGKPGASGQSIGSGSYWAGGGAGGAAGAAVNGNSKITWTVQGTILGSIT